MPLSQIVSDSIENGAVAPVDLSSIAQYTGFKNRIINGGMVIDQRNAGASGTGQNNYPVDRWNYYANQASKGTWQQNAGSVTPPAGFTNYLGFTSSSAYSVLTGDVFAFRQAIEGFNAADFAWGTANAATVTLSFRVYSSLTGTFGGAIQNEATTRAYPFSYSISSANTWTTISITISGDTTGTWVGATNGTAMRVVFSLGSGATYSATANAWTAGNIWSATGATSVVGTNGATFYITGVQLEKGVTATSFDFRDYGRELMMCQRYYWKLPSGRSTIIISSPYTGVASNAWLFLPNPVTMRAAPTVASSGWAGTVPASTFGGAEFLSFNSASYDTYIGGNTIVQASAEI